MQEYQQRVVNELEEVRAFYNVTRSRLDGLNAFFGSATFAKASVDEQTRLRQQAATMTDALAVLPSYRKILEERIAAF
jgi:3-phenylpropionate/cinnamic acid dioxygenase small subunit